MSNENDDITLKDLIASLITTIKFILSKWKQIVFFSIIGGVLLFAYGFFKKPKYNGKLTFVLEGASNTSGIASLASSFGISTGSEEGVFSNTNLMAILKSRKLVEETLLEKIPNENKTFIDKYIDVYELRNEWDDVEGIENLKFYPVKKREKFSILQDSVLRLVYADIVENRLNITIPNSENTIVSVDFISQDEKISKYFPEILMKNATVFYIESKTKKQKDNVDVLQKQVDSVRLELLNSIAGVASTNDQVFGLNPAMNVARVPSLNRQVDVQANTAVLTELVKNLELAKMNLMNDTPFVQIIDKPIFPLEKLKMSPLILAIIGMVLFGFLTILYILGKRYLNNLTEKK